MRKLVIALLLLAAVGLAAPPAKAAPILQMASIGFKSSLDNVAYDYFYGPWAPPGADFSAFDFTTGLGSISYTFSGAGDYYVAGFFDYQWIELNPCPGGPPCEGNGIFNETVYYGGSLPSGLSVEANDSFAGTVYTNFQAFNFVTGFYNSILLSPPYDAAVGMGYQFSLGAGDPARKITFTVSLANPGGFYLYQGDANAQEQIQPPYVYFSATSGDAGEPVIPEPGTMLLLGSGLIACARRLRRR